MLSINTNTQIFIYCPANCVTGGTELLHQLGEQLNNNNLNAYLYYYSLPKADIPEAFRKYGVKKIDVINDQEYHIAIFPEVAIHHSLGFKNIQSVFWWLSVDNYYSQPNLSLIDIWHHDKYLCIKTLSKRLYWQFFKFKHIVPNPMSLKRLATVNALNLYQSEYAHYFLLKKGFKQILPLKDYINTDFFINQHSNSRKNQVLYNPRKGLSFTRQLIKLGPDIQWVPMEGYSRQELVKLMQESKLYIDFGNHPGKDRLPREAAINGCCVITGIQGAAGFFEDVCINSKYKFNEYHTPISNIIKAIKDVLENYEIRNKEFDFYRQRILLEKNEFARQVKEIFLLSLITNNDNKSIEG